MARLVRVAGTEVLGQEQAHDVAAAWRDDGVEAVAGEVGAKMKSDWIRSSDTPRAGC